MDERQAPPTGARRWRSALAAGALLAAGCGTAASMATMPGTTVTPEAPGTSASASTTSVAPTGFDAELTLGSMSGMAVIDPTTGATRTGAPSAVPSGDGTRWLTSAPGFDTTGEITRVAVFDPASGTEEATVTTKGRWIAKVASADGRALALTGTAPLPATGQLAPPRERTTLMIMRPPDQHPQLLDLEGNFTPEAFSLDTTALFVLQFTPATAPERYRVRRLDLATGAVSDVLDRDKAPQTDMPGQARQQVRAPDGSALYTLYTVDAGHGHHEGPHAFVHVLDLRDQYAHCIDLPAPFGSAAQEVAALAVAPDGRTLFAVDRAAGAAAALDLGRLAVERSAIVPAAADQGTVTATVGTGERLFVGTGTTLTTIDTRTLREVASTPVTSHPTALYQSPISGHLYVATEGPILVYDNDVRFLRTLRAGELGSVLSIGPGAGPLPAQREAYECAC